MLVAAGVLFTTTSCVDDTESSSVTDLRSAKSGQLKALASLATAQAGLATAQGEALKIAADAAKIQAEGEAKYNEALAKLNEALAKEVEAQTDIAKAEAATAKAKAEEELRKVISDNDLVIAENKEALDKLALQLQIDLITLQAELKVAKATANAEIVEALGTLTGEYKAAIGALNIAAIDLATKTAQKNKLEFELKSYSYDSARLVHNFIIDQQYAIRGYKNSIKNDSIALLEWQAFAQNPDVTAEIAEVQAELDALKPTLPGLYATAVAKQEEYDATLDTITALSLIRSNFLALTGGYYVNKVSSSYIGDDRPDRKGVWTDYDGKVYTHQGPLFQNPGVYYLSGWSNTRNANLYSKYVENWDDHDWYTLSFSYSTDKYSSLEDYLHRNSVTKLKKDSTDAIANILKYQEDLVDLHEDIKIAGELETVTYNNEKTTLAAYEAALEVWNAITTTPTRGDSLAINNARKAWNGTDYTPAYGKVVDSLRGAEGAARRAHEAYLQLNDQVSFITGQIVSAKTAYTNAVSAIETYYNHVKILSYGPLAKIDQALEDVRKVRTEKQLIALDAWGLYNEASGRTLTLSNRINTLDVLEGLLTSGGQTSYYDNKVQSEVTTAIENLQKRIKTNTEYLARAEFRLTDVTDAVYGGYYLDIEDTYKDGTVAQIIAYRKADIAALTEEITVLNGIIPALQANVDYLKAAIDALLAQ
jgi:hypothetical protein